MRFFEAIRRLTIGGDHEIETPLGRKPLIYLDWTASGRMYRPLEEKMIQLFGPMVANTHTESNATGAFTTRAYHEALCRIKKHVNAAPADCILTEGSGATGVINKLQRILGLRLPERFRPTSHLKEQDKPVVFVTHMEHHSNHVSWLETIADVVIIPPDENGKVSPSNLQNEVEKYQHRPLKIGAFTACSNVTGIITPYHTLAKVMHEFNGYCFVDFAASAPYVHIDMHPADPLEKLDAIYFSPHKFLGGPGSCGILLFDSALYSNKVPDHPGGGTVMWTNPWGGKEYIEEIEEREDGGTPNFLQTIRAALAITLKEKLMQNGMAERKEELFNTLWQGLYAIDDVVILEKDTPNRLGILSFYIPHLHYNLIVKMLDERFGIQVRGGCSCAGTYGHYLLGIEPNHSKRITDQVSEGNLLVKPGWIRVSLHPTNTEAEIHAFIDAVKQIIRYGEVWQQDYQYDPDKNEFKHREEEKQSIHYLFEW